MFLGPVVEGKSEVKSVKSKWKHQNTKHTEFSKAFSKQNLKHKNTRGTFRKQEKTSWTHGAFTPNATTSGTGSHEPLEQKPERPFLKFKEECKVFLQSFALLFLSGFESCSSICFNFFKSLSAKLDLIELLDSCSVLVVRCWHQRQSGTSRLVDS